MDEEFIKALGGTLTLEVMDKNALRAFAWVPPASDFELGREE
ncbi:hypothetical protein PI124_g17038 [Phytophthora idaei]|nr:hypothetical protein PI126_g16167 [Phytophthora idaei]KAG3237992.1 hypothetical protein PI124_g17038 [Phytophthora idaei]